MDPLPPSGERLASRLGRMAKSRPPPSRARRIAWIVLGAVVIGLTIGYLLGWIRPPYLDRLERDVRDRQEREAPAPQPGP